jgi:hypothetical protein
VTRLSFSDQRDRLRCGQPMEVAQADADVASYLIHSLSKEIDFYGWNLFAVHNFGQALS